LIPEHPILINRINRILVDNGKVGEAINNLENLVGKYPENTKIKYRLAQAYRRNGQLDAAEQVAKESLKQKESASSLYEFGTIKLLKREFAEAENILIQANRKFIIETGNPTYWVYTNLAISQLVMKKKEEFQNNINKAKENISNRLKRTPNHPNLHGNYGMCLLLEQNPNASDYFEKSFKLNIPISIARSYEKRITLIKEIEGKNFITQPSIKIIRSYIKKKNNLLVK